MHRRKWDTKTQAWWRVWSGGSPITMNIICTQPWVIRHPGSLSGTTIVAAALSSGDVLILRCWAANQGSDPPPQLTFRTLPQSTRA